MQNIINKIDYLETCNKKDKKETLLVYLKDPAFKKFLIYTLDESKSYYVSRVTKMAYAFNGDIYDYLDILNAQGSATKDQKVTLAGLGSQSEAHLTVLNKILRGNTDCGVTAKLMNEVAPGVVPYFPYQRCSTDLKLDKIFAEAAKRNCPVYSELKENGQFIRIVMDRQGWNSLEFETRNGKKLDFMGVCEEHFADPHDCILEGEALVVDENGNDLPRTLGNAIINKFQDGHGTVEEAKRIRFSIWNVLSLSDYAAGSSRLSVTKRRAMVANLMEDYFQGKPVTQTETIEIETKEEAWDHYHEVRSRPTPDPEIKMEGTVVKLGEEIWKDGTSSFMAKCKAVKECEVWCTGTLPGKAGGKYENCIGSLVFRSECGGLEGKTSGMTDKQRLMGPEEFIDHVIGVTFNGVSKSKDVMKKRSFDHCRFDEPRPDKKHADTLEYILKVKSIKR